MPPKKRPAAAASNGPSVPKQSRLTSFIKVTSSAEKTDSKLPTTEQAKTSSLADLVVDSGWQRALKSEFEKDYFKSIESFLDKEYKAGKEIFPPKHQIFNALNLTPLDDVRAVIIGQDPYHDVGQAHGLCFSVCRGVKAPPSLKNMFKELSTDIAGFKTPSHGCLEHWAKQGVLLLNATLTVRGELFKQRYLHNSANMLQFATLLRAHEANSHAQIGWQTFTDAVIKLVSAKRPAVVFILWGGFAHKKEKLVDTGKHAVVKSAHPSPLSASKFLGSKCFSKANCELKRLGLLPIDWCID